MLSIFIAALILWSSLSIVRETLNILLEGTPRGCSLAEIRVSLQAIDGVQDVHDLHVWSLGSQTHALATHITIDDIPPSESARILEQVNGTLRKSSASITPPSSSNVSNAKSTRLRPAH